VDHTVGAVCDRALFLETIEIRAVIDRAYSNNVNSSRFKVITPRDLEDYRERATDITKVAWPEFMRHNPVANRNWHELFDRFEEYQFAMWDVENNRMAAIGNSVPFSWVQPLEELPERGWEWVFLKAVEDHKSGLPPNIQSALQIAIHPEYQGQGLSMQMVRVMQGIGKSKGFRYLVAPVRPNQKSEYPRVSIDEYVTWTNQEALPFDAWLRVHVRAGARILKPCHEAMTIVGTRAEWESWTGLKFLQSGEHHIPGALNPMEMNLEKDEGVYVEPNVWMVHAL
jgi:GNAT superfamily N-acetyltransferase